MRLPDQTSHAKTVMISDCCCCANSCRASSGTASPLQSVATRKGLREVHQGIRGARCAQSSGLVVGMAGAMVQATETAQTPETAPTTETAHKRNRLQDRNDITGFELSTHHTKSYIFCVQRLQICVSRGISLSWWGRLAVWGMQAAPPLCLRPSRKNNTTPASRHAASHQQV